MTLNRDSHIIRNPFVDRIVTEKWLDISSQIWG